MTEIYLYVILLMGLVLGFISGSMFQEFFDRNKRIGWKHVNKSQAAFLVVIILVFIMVALIVTQTIDASVNSVDLAVIG